MLEGRSVHVGPLHDATQLWSAALVDNGQHCHALFQLDGERRIGAHRSRETAEDLPLDELPADSTRRTRLELEQHVSVSRTDGAALPVEAKAGEVNPRLVARGHAEQGAELAA